MIEQYNNFAGQHQSSKSNTTNTDTTTTTTTNNRNENNKDTMILVNCSVPFSSLHQEQQEQQEHFPEGEGEDKPEQTEEGLVFVKMIVINEGKIDAVILGNRITELFDIKVDRGVRVIDCKNCVLCPLFIDAHTHLIKTHCVARARNPSGSVPDALAVEMADQPRWIDVVGNKRIKTDSATINNETDLERRFDFAIQSAIHYGSVALRTHLDGTNNVENKVLRDLVFEVFARKRNKLKGSEEYGEIFLQGVCNLYLPLWSMKEIAEEFVEAAAKYNCKENSILLGAYCGVVGRGGEEELKQTRGHFENLFSYANKYSLNVDIHIDETNDPSCCAIVPLLEAFLNKDPNKRTQTTFDNVKHISLSHACSLALQPKDVYEKVISLIKRINENTNAKITVIVNPLTNLGLQDRRGTTDHVGVGIDRDTPRTPLWRGIAPIQELDSVGINCCAGSDNVRDWWHPYSDYDGLNTLKSAIELAHLNTAPNEGYWFKLLNENARKAMFLHEKKIGLIAKGYRADFILFPSSRRFSELFSRSQHTRIVFRKGKICETALPDYEELDDLLQTITDTSNFIGKDDLKRGVTKTIM